MFTGIRRRLGRGGLGGASTLLLGRGSTEGFERLFGVIRSRRFRASVGGPVHPPRLRVARIDEFGGQRDDLDAVCVYSVGLKGEYERVRIMTLDRCAPAL